MVFTTASDHFYDKALISNTEFAQVPTFKFGFVIITGAMVIYNDSTDKTVEYSFNGEDLHGIVPAKDKWHSLDRKKESKIWLRVDPLTPGTVQVRLEAYP